MICSNVKLWVDIFLQFASRQSPFEGLTFTWREKISLQHKSKKEHCQYTGFAAFLVFEIPILRKLLYCNSGGFHQSKIILTSFK